MRKQYKRKKRCCAMCKAHKRGKANRWKIKDKDALLRQSKECREHNEEDN